MQFAANPREFDRSGLPKYGADLSDDDYDIEPYEGILEDENYKNNISGRDISSGSIDGGGISSSGSGSNSSSASVVRFAPTIIESYMDMNGGNIDKNMSVYSNVISNASSNIKNSSSNNNSSSGNSFVKEKKRNNTLNMIRNEVKETKAARERGDLIGDLSYIDNNKNTTKSGVNNSMNKQNSSFLSSLNSRGTHDLFRPYRDTVAYDSDLDHESDGSSENDMQ